MFRVLALALLLAGIVFITIGYTKMSFKCPPPRVEYRYIPRQIYEEQIYDNNVMKTFQNMFQDQTPGIASNISTPDTSNTPQDNE
tara:strand:- start:421 stop:675 length:255 start_codon:yes stop_codon:yes gene_type:complete